MPKIIGIGGYAGSGKDAVASILNHHFGYTRFFMSMYLRDMVLDLNPLIAMTPSEQTALGRPLKGYIDFDAQIKIVPYNAIYIAVGYEKSKEIPAVREFYQDLGDNCRRVFGDDVWVEKVYDLAHEYSTLYNQNVVITGIRYENELAPLATDPDYHSIWIERPGVGPVNDHVSEMTLTEDDFECKIVNDGTLEQLADKVVRLVKEL